MAQGSKTYVLTLGFLIGSWFGNKKGGSPFTNNVKWFLLSWAISVVEEYKVWANRSFDLFSWNSEMHGWAGLQETEDTEHVTGFVLFCWYLPTRWSQWKVLANYRWFHMDGKTQCWDAACGFPTLPVWSWVCIQRQVLDTMLRSQVKGGLLWWFYVENHCIKHKPRQKPGWLALWCSLQVFFIYVFSCCSPLPCTKRRLKKLLKFQNVVKYHKPRHS